MTKVNTKNSSCLLSAKYMMDIVGKCALEERLGEKKKEKKKRKTCPNGIKVEKSKRG